MRIGIDARMYGPKVTGIGNYIKHITELITREDRENEYFIFLKPENYPNFESAGGNIHKVLSPYHWYTFREQSLFLLQLLKYNLDLVHFPNFNIPVLYPKKFITTIHDLTPLFFPGHRMTANYRKKAFNYVFEKAITKAEKIITVSQATKADIRHNFSIPENKIFVTYEGVDNHFKKVTDYGKIKEIKQQYGIKRPFIFYVGVWRSHKNLLGLISAFKLLRTKYNLDIQLVIGGAENPHYKEPQKLIRKLNLENLVIKPGFIAEDDLIALYSCAEAFVLPSYYEGFGLIGLEAQACGCPLVCSNTTSLPEIMGNGAYFFDPHNTAEMAQKIYDVLTNKSLRDTLIKNGLYNIQRFSWAKCASQTLSIYNQFHAQKEENQKEN